jgi:type II secretory ATPase GspE/PulE/Tfp pilus assembly ATPase PilB-like protein
MSAYPATAKEEARRLVNRFVFEAVQSGASEAQILFDGQRIKTAYCLNSDWRRQADMPAAIWPQLLRRVRNMAFLPVGPQPLRQEGSINLTIVPKTPNIDDENRDYTLKLVISHVECRDEIRIIIGDPGRRPCAIHP